MRNRFSLLKKKTADRSDSSAADVNVSRDSRGVDHLDDILRDALLC